MWNRTGLNFPHSQGPVARRELRHALRFCAPEIFCLVQGVTPVMGPGESSPMDLGEAKRSRSPSAASPAAFWVISLVPPGEAQRSGFAGKRRSKGTSAVFAARRKRSRVDFATTSRHGQSNPPSADGGILCKRRAILNCPLIRPFGPPSPQGEGIKIGGRRNLLRKKQKTLER